MHVDRERRFGFYGARQRVTGRAWLRLTGVIGSIMAGIAGKCWFDSSQPHLLRSNLIEHHVKQLRVCALDIPLAQVVNQ